MKIEILKEKENKPLSRKEIDFKVDHSGESTPSRADICAKIVAQYDADTSRVVVKTLHTQYGIGMTEGSARIYSDPEMMQRIELSHILKRHEPKKKEVGE
ncbi:MAG: 30S ribosomal protein S24e [Candidatus Thorarchaeota archaeon]|nr:30S ribosomal protein S24e [Candidatus Thorarchaeota archaeon]